MATWKSQLRVDEEGVRLLLSDRLGHDLLKARLPFRSQHPRGLLTLLEGAALYSGDRLDVATSVARSAVRDSIEDLFGNPLTPIDSALVRFDFVTRAARGRRLHGLGSFREVRSLARWKEL